MATCENCSTSFTPNPNATEVVSTRILCPKCEAARRAEKQRKAAAAAAAGTARPAARPAAGASAAAGAPPVPAARRVAPASAAPASASGAAAARTARPQAPRDAAPAPAPSATSRAAVKPAPKVEKPAGRTSDVRREAELIKREQNKIFMYAWIVCGVLMLIAAVVVFSVWSTKKREADLRAAQIQAIEDFAAKVKSYDTNVESQASEVVALIEANKPKWEDQKTAPDIGAVLSKARTRLDTLANERELQRRLDEAEKAAGDVANTDAQKLKSLRRNMEDLEMRSDVMGGDFKSRMIAVRTNLDRAYVTRLHDEAKAAKGPEALALFSTAEDETLKLFENAYKRKNVEQEAFFKKHLDEIYAESDALVASLFPPEVLEKMPWEDLLTEAAKKDLWQDDGLDGFRVEGGQLVAIGPKPGATKDGLMAVPKAGGWRDFQLNMEFEFSGTIDTRYRLGRRVDHTVPSLSVSTVGNDASFVANQKYTLTATMLGSKLTILIEGADEPIEWSQDLGFIQQRKGAFGVVMTAGSELKASKLRVRLMR